MKKIDLGVKYGDTGVMASPQLPEPYYPSLRIEKEIGDFEVGDKIFIHGEGIVTATNETEKSCCYTIEVKKAAFSSKEKDFEKMSDSDQRKMMEEDID